MEVREKSVWSVCSGGHTRWFSGEVGAREYAQDRYDNEFDGIPFVSELTLTEALGRLNELEDESNAVPRL